MKNEREKLYRNIAVTAVMVVIAVTVAFRMVDIYNGAVARPSESAARQPSSVVQDYTGGDYAEADLPDDVLPAAADDETGSFGSYADADVFFSDRMSDEGDKTKVPNGALTRDGTLLLAAAGLSVDQLPPVLPGVPAIGQDSEGISLAKRLAASSALYPNGPLAMMASGIAIDPNNVDAGLTALPESITGVLLIANRLLNENRQIVDQLLKSADRPRRKIYLTVDDGPSRLTGQYLTLLKERGVRATFFVVGKNVERYPDIIKRMYDDGHCIANHSYTHNYERLYNSISALKAEIEKCDAAIDGVLGFDYSKNIFRFPGGSGYKLATKYRNDVKNLGYAYYDWNVLNGDAQIADKSPENLYNYMLSTYKNQDEVIMLTHDSDTKQSTIDMLGRAIDFFTENGYDFYTLDEK
jgi:peptidoglycan/xylan/chitin deacetylase (PgdA/CDA1 family)